MGLSFLVLLMSWLIRFLGSTANGLGVKSGDILSVSLQWAFPVLLGPGLLEVNEHAELLHFSDGGFSLVREPREDFSEELPASGGHPYTSLVLRGLCQLGSILQLGGMLGKGTGKWRVKKRDLTFESVSLVFSPFDVSGKVPRSLVRTWDIYVALREKIPPFSL